MSPGYVKVINSVFFIFKKSGRLRKIIDCRPSNAYYKPSEDSTLPGPWHATDVQGGQFYSGEADVESAFTRVRVLPWMWKYQGLPSVHAREVMTEGELSRGELCCPVTGAWLRPDSTAVPVYLRLPMGGTRSGDIMLDVVETLLKKELGSEPHLETFHRPSTKSIQLT